MKFFALLAFVGFAAAVRLGTNGELKWQPDHEYVYTYRGRLLTGLPELAEKHFSGMGIHAKIHLQAQSSTRVVLRISEAQYSKVNEVLESREEGQEGHNWRYLNLPNFTPVPEQTMRLLAMPTVFEVSEESGKIRSVTVSHEEPEWSVNFKKALIVLFQTQTGESSTVRTNSLREFSEGEVSPITNYWTTMEESVDGECETRYELNELPEATIFDNEILTSKKVSEFELEQEQEQELESGVESETHRRRESVLSSGLPSVCPSNSKVFEIVKVKNVNRCVRRSTFAFYKPGGYECHPDSESSKTGNCEGMFARSSVTRYTVCGSSEYDYVILSILNEGELTQDLMGFKSEKMLTGTRQVLNLVNKNRVGREFVSGPTNPITLTSLFYEYNLKKSPEALKKDLGTRQSILQSLPFLDADLKHGEKEAVKEEIKRIVKEVVSHDLFTLEGLPETQVTMKALGLAKGFSLMAPEEIEQIYHSLKSEFSSSERHEVFKNIFFDSAMMSGTISSVRFLKKMILEGEMSAYQAESVLLSMARSLVTPTTPILEEVFELVRSSKVMQMSEGNNFHNSAILGFSTLVQKACLAENRNTSYPTFVFGKFCHHDSYIVGEKWIPYLSKFVYRSESVSGEKKSVAIVALGLLSHKNVLPAIYHVLENPREFTPLQRTLAVYALTKTGRHHPQRVLPVLSAIFSNRAERTEVRVAAFTTMMKLKPDMYILQKIATLTWVETDLEILKLVNTAFYSISESIAMQDVKQESAALVRKIRLVYPLIKKTGGKFPTTGAIYMNDFLKHLNVGFEKVVSWTSTKVSPLPTDYYSKITYFLDNYRYTPLEYSFHLRGSGSLIQEVLEIITGKASIRSGSSSGRFSSQEEELVNKVTGEWRKVVEKLNIEPRRDSDRPEGALYLNLFETTPIFKSFARESSEALKEKIHRVLRNPASLMGENKKISYQRMLNLAPTIINIPSDMGLPIAIEIHMPMVMSLQGEVEPEMRSMNKMNLKTKFHAMATVQYTGWVGTVSPFDGEYIVSGIDQHAVINFPNEFNVNVDMREQTVKVSMKPRTEMAGRPVDLLHYHVRPFTVIQKLYDIKPLTLSSHFKVIKSTYYQKSEVEPREESVPFLKSLGLGLTYNYLAPIPHGPVAPSLIEKFRMYNSNILNVFRFTFVSTAFTPSKQPSVRMHYIKIKQHPEKASTKEIEWTLKYGVASKQSESKPLMYHTIEESQESSKVLPVAIVSKPIGEHSRHQTRQMKIKQIFEKNSIKTGYGYGFEMTTKLIGSAPRTITWWLSAGFGRSAELKTKWDIKLEDNENKKVCFNGDIDLPLTSDYSIHKMRSEENRYRFETKLGYGNSCEDKVIKVVGHAKTSEKQKEHSLKSQEAKELERLIAKRVPLAQLSKVAEKVRRQATKLDEVEYEVIYERIPTLYVYMGDKVVDFLEVYWLPYLEMPRSGRMHALPSLSAISKTLLNQEVKEVQQIEGEESLTSALYSTKSGKVTFKLHFHPVDKTMSVIIVKSDSERPIKFEGIRLPFPLSYYFPIATAYNPVYPMVESLVGASFNPVCKVEGNELSTYDNHTMKMRLTECFHLLSSDCGHRGVEDWSVLMSKSKEDSSRKVIKIFIKSVPILLIPESREKIIIKVHNQEFPIHKGQSRSIESQNGNEVVATIIKANDETITVKSTWFNLKFNGELIEVLPSPIYKSKLCGLCGNYNGDKADEMLSPRMCLLSKPELLEAAYAVPSEGQNINNCMSESTKQMLHKETNVKCVKVNPSSGIRNIKAAASVSGLPSERKSQWLNQNRESQYNRENESESQYNRENEYESQYNRDSEYERRQNENEESSSWPWWSTTMRPDQESESQYNRENKYKHQSQYNRENEYETRENENENARRSPWWPTSTMRSNEEYELSRSEEKREQHAERREQQHAERREERREQQHAERREEAEQRRQAEIESEMEQRLNLGRDSECERRAHYIINRGSKVCVSNKPVRACSESCKPVEEETKEVSFHCMREGSRKAEEIVERVRNGEVIPELEEMSRDVEREIQVPESCRPTSRSSSQY